MSSKTTYTYNVRDDSITTEFYTPLWTVVADYIPSSVAPNLITFFGFLMNLMSLSIALSSSELNAYNAIRIALYLWLAQMADAIDGIHARQTQQSSELGEYFDHVCDALSAIGHGLVTAVLLGANLSTPTGLTIGWYFIMIYQMIFMQFHVDSTTNENNVVVFSRYTGPGEFYLGLQCLAVLNAVSLAFANTPVLIAPNFLLGFLIIAYGGLLVLLLTTDFKSSDLYNAVITNHCIHFVMWVCLRDSYHENTLRIWTDGAIMALMTAEIIRIKLETKLTPKYLNDNYTPESKVMPYLTWIIQFAMINSTLGSAIILGYLASVMNSLSRLTKLPFY
jgi:phosphatidylglycerophosphate synthase